MWIATNLKSTQIFQAEIIILNFPEYCAIFNFIIHCVVMIKKETNKQKSKPNSPPVLPGDGNFTNVFDSHA